MSITDPDDETRILPGNLAMVARRRCCSVLGTPRPEKGRLELVPVNHSVAVLDKYHYAAADVDLVWIAGTLIDCTIRLAGARKPILLWTGGPTRDQALLGAVHYGVRPRPSDGYVGTNAGTQQATTDPHKSRTMRLH